MLNSDVLALRLRAASWGRRCLAGALLGWAALASAGLAGAGVSACTASQRCATTPPVLAMPAGPVMRKLALGGATPQALVPHAPVPLALGSARSRPDDGDELSGSASLIALLAAIGAMISLSWRRAAH